ncbi:MAG TPA: alpha/beta hydrolase fold domain-containing protein [Solirubrobacteraceae bacterium]|nr:alpha/beta hydrolase fold domain-containing protein [Solirubrobacteraceae bacterium]
MMVADMTLRFGALRVPTTVHWPRLDTVSLALVLSDELSPTDRWFENSIAVGLAGANPGMVELAALRWVAEHSGELGADCNRIVVAGGARAARLALAARDGGWPVVWRQLLIHPRFTSEQPMPKNVARAPTAIVVCGHGHDDGPLYSDRLRAAGVHVHEVCR